MKTGTKPTIGLEHMSSRVSLLMPKLGFCLFWMLRLFIASGRADEQPDGETVVLMNQWRKNWSRVTQEELQAPHNKRVLELLESASSPGSFSAQVLLVRGGSPNAIARAVEGFREKRDLRSSINLLGQSANPMVITLIEKELFRPEKDSDGNISTAAADIVQIIVSGSPAFPVEVRTWASSGPTREDLREWYNANKDALLRSDYQAVVPVRDLKGETEPSRPLPSTPLLKAEPKASTTDNASVEPATPAHLEESSVSRHVEEKPPAWPCSIKGQVSCPA